MAPPARSYAPLVVHPPVPHQLFVYPLTVVVGLAGQGLLAQPGPHQGVVIQVEAVGVLHAITGGAKQG